MPADCQPAALKAAAAVALAAAGSLQSLTLATNRGFWPAWLPQLRQLRALELCSKEGGLSLHANLTPLHRLTRLALEARHAVSLSDTARCASGLVWPHHHPCVEPP